MIISGRLVFAVGLIVLSISSFAQQTDEPPAKQNSNYVGIQINPLIRQLLSFGAVGGVTNPYVITWSVNNTITGWGFGAGFGYVYNQIKSGDAISQLNTTVNDFHFRMGPERKAKIGKRWITSFGGDIVADSEVNKTTSTSQGGFNVTTETNTGKVGLGARMTLNYAFSDRMILGTEGSYYLKFINEERKVSGSQTVTPTTSKMKSFTPTLPAVIFMIIKF
jgi:hypothetical protein